MESLFAAAAVISDATQSALTDAAFSAFSAVGSSSSSSSSSQRPSDASTPRQTQPGSSLSSLPASSTSLLPSDPSSSSSGGISGRGILGPVAAAAASAGGSIASQQPSDSQSAKSWLDSWTSLVYRGEKNELQVRGMTKEEVDRLLWDYRTVWTAGTASLISTSASFPFDSLKSRLQVKYYPSIWACAKAVFREEGIGGFFRGVFIPLITISFVRTSSFSIYVNTKESLHARGYVADTSKLKDVGLSGMAGGATSGVIISCGSAPFELVKVQRQLEYLTAVQRGLIGTQNSSPTGSGTNSPPAKFKARSGFQAAADIARNHGGIKGFYIGFPLHLTRDTLGTALYFGSYDTIRALVNRHSSSNGSLFGVPGPVVSFLSGSTAGIASWLIVYPVDLLKTNVQQRTLSNHPRQLTGYQLFMHLLRERPPPDNTKRDTAVKRFLRLYRGLGVSALRSFISHGMTWTIIETLSDRISKRTGRDVLAARA